MTRWWHVPFAGFAATRRWLLWVAFALVCLQVFFVLRIALMAWVSPHSTAFMRSEAWRRLHASTGTQATGNTPATPGRPWAQVWVDSARISPHLKRAVIASEDDGFANHQGVDWVAMESAWSRNRQQAQRAGQNGSAQPPKVVGGSTITQQLAKNLLLSGERLLPRKAQEMVLSYLLEACLSKQRILEIYLNSVEWGDGVFGAEAAAQRYFGVSAAQLSAEQAARLAVMLPAPKTFERRPHSAYLNRRTATILSRMPNAVLP
ncbi:MAG: monofunctional biosynthetic peptidoglycan transglycosylase [Burkholderiales bacterium]|nr:monofunctional biosynthetic peptidoglycan transglycosylase [Burkholderiales bacterium]